MERDLELNLILLWFICIKLKQCVWLGFYLFVLLPSLPQVLAENCLAEVAVHGMFWKFIVPEKKMRTISWNSGKLLQVLKLQRKRITWEVVWPLPYSESPVLSPQSHKIRNYQQPSYCALHEDIVQITEILFIQPSCNRWQSSENGQSWWVA